MRRSLSRTSRPLAVGAALLALLLPGTPALADPGNPTPDVLRRANDRVAAAERRLAGLQQRAELAAEKLNGALVKAKRTLEAAGVAARNAERVQGVYDAALTSANAAQAVADAATARAKVAADEQRAAEAEAAAAQLTLDRIAVGAFQNGGQLGMVSHMFMADDPLELANARNIMNHVGVYQDKVIAEAVAARVRAKAAAEVTKAAEADALASSAKAQAALDVAATAKQKADSARRSSERSAANARQAALDARSARLNALSLVAQAERLLGSARRSKAQLEAAARAARSDAAQYQDVDAPSDEARIAIHWAFEEIGTPYSWGGGDENGPTYGFAQGAGTKGYDCSGLTLFIYGKAGIHLDHYTQSQWDQGKRVSSRSELLPGDLMFFAYNTNDPSTIHHVSIYIGKGKMIEAPYTGEVVRVSSAGRSDFIGATRPWA
jgi:cell wall-associated NlpC family hydrolase